MSRFFKVAAIALMTISLTACYKTDTSEQFDSGTAGDADTDTDISAVSGLTNLV